ncbi:Sodium/sulfate symporter [Hesseltinella vesiculosa]|uniref:Sodium/sulfate symporter n=1 Tax=Hesseltinella vesiculosa TaxID=101127 RepID=A0A1X2GCB1_9FUNG|nr:Sodium/sulfate symporter [Hesseltinella vesiculosa]
MKFSHALQFNAVPEWIDKYFLHSYEHLKKTIFQLEKEKVDALNRSEEKDEEHGSKSTVDESAFLNQLDTQLEKVFDFYTQKETELYNGLDALNNALESVDREDAHQFPNNNGMYNLETLDSSIKTDEKLTAAHRRRLSMESRFTMHSEAPSHVQELADKRSQLLHLYISLSELESYVELNKTAFEKILKKHDKVLDGHLRDQYLRKMVLESRPFMPATLDTLRSQISRVEKLYADAFCQGNMSIAMRQMKIHLKDQVRFDRNTVWRDMISQERKATEMHVKEPQAPQKRYGYGPVQLNGEQLRQLVAFLFCIVVFIVLLTVNTFGNKYENYCFALLIFAAVMWATEAIPLYATSMLIPFLVVLLGVMRNPDGSPMTASAASKAVFSSMFSGTIMMLLGGFSLAAALSKYGIAKAFASNILSRAGTRPRWVLLTLMFVSAFLSMWISNVATPVMCFSLINPILRTLPDHSTVGSCLILGIALACCIAGMASPISSPQNIITMQYLKNPSWGTWFAAALPIGVISLVVCWLLLLLVYRPDRSVPHLNTVKATSTKLNGTQYFILFITILTIALWCAESSLSYALGDPGIVAAIPLFVFFGTGLLNKSDLNAFLWSVVVLAQGGMALGEAVTTSGLLKDIAMRIKDGIENLPVIAILAVFVLLILVFSTFVSHTVAALIIIPIVQQVGNNLPIPHPNLLVMGAGLACSTGQALPISGFPNLTAVMLETPTGKPYLRSKDFMLVGGITSVVAAILVITLGYGIMAGVGY